MALKEYDFNNEPTVSIVKKILTDSIKMKATDIHFMISETFQKCDIRGLKGFKSFKNDILTWKEEDSEELGAEEYYNDYLRMIDERIEQFSK